MQQDRPTVAAILVGALTICIGIFSLLAFAALPALHTLLTSSSLSRPPSPFWDLLRILSNAQGHALRNAIGGLLGLAAIGSAFGLLTGRTWARHASAASVVTLAGFHVAVLWSNHHGHTFSGRCLGASILAWAWTATAVLAPALLLRRPPVEVPAAGTEASVCQERGGFWRRLAAHLVDKAVLLIAGLGLNLAAGIALSLGHPSWPSWAYALVGVGLNLLWSGLYYTALTANGGQTLGKMLLRLKVVQSDGSGVNPRTALLRWLCYGASTLPFNVGFLWAGFEPQRKGFHDLLAGTRVVSTQSSGSRAGTAFAAVINGACGAVLLAGGILAVLFIAHLPTLMQPRQGPGKTTGTENPLAYYWLLRSQVLTDPASQIESLDWAEPITRCQPNLMAIHINRGMARAKQDDFPAALKDLDAAIAISTDCAACYYGRAGVERDMGRETAALVDVETAIRLDPTQAAFYPMRARLLAALRRHKQAEAAFQDYFQRFPNQPSIYTERGLFYSSLGRLDEGQKDLEQALTLRPKDPHTLTALAEVHLARGAYPKALEVLESYPASAGKGDQAAMLMVRSLAYMGLGDQEKGSRNWLQAAEADPIYRRGPERLAREGYTFPPQVWDMYGEGYKRFVGGDRAAKR